MDKKSKTQAAENQPEQEKQLFNEAVEMLEMIAAILSTNMLARMLKQAADKSQSISLLKKSKKPLPMNNINNSNDMKTVVQTYVLEETQALIYDDEQLQKWNDYVASLGLIGQTEIVKPQKSPIPFLHMPAALNNAFETLCPVQVAVEDYNISPIPVEVLELVALAKKEHYFDIIQIWYDGKTPDPACIGIKYNGWYSRDKNSYLDNKFKTKAEAIQAMEDKGVHNQQPCGTEEEKYLLARWGDVKRTFEELASLAHARYLKEQTASLTKVLKETQRQIDELAEKAAGMFLANGEPADDFF